VDDRSGNMRRNTRHISTEQAFVLLYWRQHFPFVFVFFWDTSAWIMNIKTESGLWKIPCDTTFRNPALAKTTGFPSNNQSGSHGFYGYYTRECHSDGDRAFVNVIYWWLLQNQKFLSTGTRALY
jgi:hypothetical protein